MKLSPFASLKYSNKVSPEKVWALLGIINESLNSSDVSESEEVSMLRKYFSEKLMPICPVDDLDKKMEELKNSMMAGFNTGNFYEDDEDDEDEDVVETEEEAVE